jgi:DNA-binding transcriptional MocR family regulator
MNILDSQNDFLYGRIARKFARQIKEGVLRPGDRLPSVRRLSKTEKVSMSTAWQAYMLLENRDLIRARPQSGFYVRPISASLLEPQITAPISVPTEVSLSELAASILSLPSNQDIVPYGAVNPAPELLPIKKLNRILAAVSARANSVANAYSPSSGMEELRRQIARRTFESGVSSVSDDVIVTCGATEAINLCLRAVVKPGDTIAVESPTYFGILQMIESLGLRAIEIPTQARDGVCLNALERAIKQHQIKACLFVLNFSNPLGSLMPDETKRKLVALLARADIPLIEDDIYGDLHFGAARPKAAKAFDSEGMVMLCSSVSKTIAPGYRIGWTLPGKYKSQVEILKQTNTLTTPTLLQLAIAEFFESDRYNRHLRAMRTTVAEHMERASTIIAKYFPEGTKITRPVGGCVLWVELPKLFNTLALHKNALEKGISISPGRLFASTAQYNHCFRLNCGHPWSNRMENALKTLGKFTKKT